MGIDITTAVAWQWWGEVEGTREIFGVIGMFYILIWGM